RRRARLRSRNRDRQDHRSCQLPRRHLHAMERLPARAARGPGDHRAWLASAAQETEKPSTRYHAERRIMATLAIRLEPSPEPQTPAHIMSIELKNVTKTYPARQDTDSSTIRAVDSVSLSVARGGWVAIMGPSGPGKST